MHTRPMFTPVKLWYVTLRAPLAGQYIQAQTRGRSTYPDPAGAQESIASRSLEPAMRPLAAQRNPRGQRRAAVALVQTRAPTWRKGTERMKPASFLAGLLCGVLATAGAVTMSAIDLTHHDAHGRTQHGTATLNSIRYDSTSALTMFVDYTSDDLFCNAFGP